MAMVVVEENKTYELNLKFDQMETEEDESKKSENTKETVVEPPLYRKRDVEEVERNQ